MREDTYFTYRNWHVELCFSVSKEGEFFMAYYGKGSSDNDTATDWHSICGELLDSIWNKLPDRLYRKLVAWCEAEGFI